MPGHFVLDCGRDHVGHGARAPGPFRNEFFPPRASLSSLPPQIDGWNGTDIPLDQDTLDILGPASFSYASTKTRASRNR